MFRSILSAIALASALATAVPAIADPLATSAADPVRLTATAAAQPATSAPASSSDTAATIGHDRDVAPAGFGWG
jgi:hypothetical protein